MKKYLRPILLGAGILLLLLLLAGAVLVMTALRPLTIEAGETPPPAAAYARYRFLTPIDVSGKKPDTSIPGVHTVDLQLLGFDRKAMLTVQDTAAPTAVPLAPTCFLGDSLTVKHFYTDLCDATQVEVSFVGGEPDYSTPGEHPVSLRFTDAADNVFTLDTTLTVHAISHTLTIEVGMQVEGIKRLIRRAIVGETLTFAEGFDALEGAAPGEYPVYLTLDGERVRLFIMIEDTTPPFAEPQEAAALRGQVLPADAFVAAGTLEDETAVAVDYAVTPDFDLPGGQAVTVMLTDAAGNRSELEASLVVYDAPSVFVAELCTAADDLRRVLLGDSGLVPADESAFAEQRLGETELVLLTPDGEKLVQRITFVDTTPPVGESIDRVAYLDHPIDAAAFVPYVADASAVTVSYADGGAPDFGREGVQTVTLLLTDEGGNTTALSAALTVQKDTEPPVLRGVSDKRLSVGESISYRQGVSAHDACDGNVTVLVDSSKVNLKKAGSYPLTYSAVDAAGNRAEKTVTVTVLASAGVSTETVNAVARQVLAGILRDGMSERERLRAIFDWTTTHLSYTAYPDKTDYIAAANYGFRNGRGDCFVYYAVSRVLLTCAGIQNLEIHRNIPNQPHFWNLVYCEGAWYHFDACPHYAAHPLTCFLLTDAEVRAYSEHHVANYYSFDASLYPATP